MGQSPLFASMRGWSRKDLGGDAFAGLTLAAIAIPEQMATARLGDLSPKAGFLAFLAGAVAFALFGSSRHISVGADSTITPIFAAGLVILAASGSPHHEALAALLALMEAPQYRPPACCGSAGSPICFLCQSRPAFLPEYQSILLPHSFLNCSACTLEAVTSSTASLRSMTA
jgi:hypothetical protein